MRSIKIGILALYCLLFALFAVKDLEFGTEWGFAEYTNSFIGVTAGLLSMVLILACALMPASAGNVSVTILDAASLKALVQVLEEQEDNNETP